MSDPILCRVCEHEMEHHYFGCGSGYSKCPRCNYLGCSSFSGGSCTIEGKDFRFYYHPNQTPEEVAKANQTRDECEKAIEIAKLRWKNPS